MDGGSVGLALGVYVTFVSYGKVSSMVTSSPTMYLVHLLFYDEAKLAWGGWEDGRRVRGKWAPRSTLTRQRFRTCHVSRRS